MKIAAEIRGEQYSRDAVLAWEDKRFAPAAKKLGVPAPVGGDVSERRASFLATKLELGPEEIRRRLDRDVRWSDRVGRMTTRLGSRRQTSATDVHVEGGVAESFVQWFEAAAADADQRAMLRANPDHYVIGPGPQGQEVLETTGGSPLATYFVVDYDDVSSLVTPADSDFPHQIAGVARALDGTAIGGVRHQFRDTATGFHARLTVEFPIAMAPWMISAHRWHLACEFSNWIEDAVS